MKENKISRSEAHRIAVPLRTIHHNGWHYKQVAEGRFKFLGPCPNEPPPNLGKCHYTHV